MQRGALRPFSLPNRTPSLSADAQAKLWRQSRAIQEITAAIKKLASAKANFLASVLDGVGPQHGPHVTNALPGPSWLRWG